MSVYFVKGKGWRFDFTLTGLRFTGAGYKTKKAAKQAETDRRKEVIGKETVQPVPPAVEMTLSPGVSQAVQAATVKTDMVFVQLLEKRLDHLKAYRSATHFTDNWYMSKRWSARWGAKMCDEITTDDLEKFLTERKRVSARTANKELRLLRAVFRFGKKKRLISADPTEGIEFYPVERRVPYMPPPADIQKVIAVASKNSRDYLLTIRETMARVGEINRLTWPDVDLENSSLVLCTRKKRDGSLTPRRIPMTETLHEILARRFKKRDPEKPWVFWHRHFDRRTGETYEGPYKDRKSLMRTLCKKAGVKYFRFHALRHAGASLMDHSNVPISSIQRILGHEQRTTTEIYLHSIGQSERAAIETFEQAWKKVSHQSHTKVENEKKEGA